MYKQGDILIDEDGDKRKVLGVCGLVYILSCVKDFNDVSDGLFMHAILNETELKRYCPESKKTR